MIQEGENLLVYDKMQDFPVIIAYSIKS
jgi:hypothetical protein